VSADEFDLRPMLDALVAHEVDFVLIGGLAAIVHGSARATFDLDIAYGRSTENLERLSAALEELGATLRGAPPNLPFRPDAEMLRSGLNFTFSTTSGSLDALGEPAGAPMYEELRRRASFEQVSGLAIAVSSIDDLIAMKEAAGRPHDQATAAELRVLSDEQRSPD
jgi:Nucleotidyl transferase AbiEii toxin, Type IV TA system